MFRRCVRVLRTFVVAGVVCACGHDPGPIPVEPLDGAVPIDVSLVKTAGISGTGLPRFQATGFSGGLETTWEVVKGTCLLASAMAVRADSVVQIEIHLSADPLADCAAGPVGYRFIARVLGLPRGRYQVRLVDATLGVPPAEIGRKAVDVSP